MKFQLYLGQKDTELIKFIKRIKRKYISKTVESICLGEKDLIINYDTEEKEKTIKGPVQVNLVFNNEKLIDELEDLQNYFKNSYIKNKLYSYLAVIEYEKLNPNNIKQSKSKKEESPQKKVCEINTGEKSNDKENEIDEKIEENMEEQKNDFLSRFEMF